MLKWKWLCCYICVYMYKCMRIHWYTYIVNMCFFMSIRINICTCSYVDMVYIRNGHMIVVNPLRSNDICLNMLTITGPDCGLLPRRRQAIIRTNGRMLWFWPLGITSMKFKSKFTQFLFKKTSLKIPSAKWRPFVSAWIALTDYQW